MAPTPSPRPSPANQTPARTPSSKQRLHFPPGGAKHPAPAPLCATRDAGPTEHPVEVIGRIRDHPEKKEKLSSALEISNNGTSVRVRTESICRDFALDGMSVAAEEDLEGFYNRFVRSRIEGVRIGAKCTVMMYGPTGSGKSHTMFGCGKQPGIVYRALRDILGGGEGVPDDAGFAVGIFVQVAVLEIYNEEIYDLLSGNANAGIPKGNAATATAAKVRLEVMGKKAKNAMYISGNEASKISKEVAKVEKRRIVKSTLCNERSSRSHCMIILDVPSVGGRLMLVDMAGSENIEAAGQSGFEAKMQTAKINQGNVALKRVVESIANGDSHVPFRDSKLTMLLQDSFEDDKSKILMILCASPDPKEMHKTLSTLEYGAKAKCIVRAAHAATPKDRANADESTAVLLNARIAAMNQFICKLQMENRLREKERDDARGLLLLREEEMAQMKAKMNPAAMEEEINSKVMERTQVLRLELAKMEEKMTLQQFELDRLKCRLQEVEQHTKEAGGVVLLEVEGGRLAARIAEMCSGEQAMVMSMSMDLDAGDQPCVPDVVKEIKEDTCKISQLRSRSPAAVQEETRDADSLTFPGKETLSTVYEEEEEEEEVDKQVVEENGGCGAMEPIVETDSARKVRIENIFRLCGDYRELAKHANGARDESDEPEPPSHKTKRMSSDIFAEEEEGKENSAPAAVGGGKHEDDDAMVEVYLKWEASKESSGGLMSKVKLLPTASLSELRKLVEVCVEEHAAATPTGKKKKPDDFVFLLLGDPTGAPVAREKETTVPVSKLPACGGGGHLACLRRPGRKGAESQLMTPLSSLENKLGGLTLSPNAVAKKAPADGSPIRHLALLA